VLLICPRRLGQPYLPAPAPLAISTHITPVAVARPPAESPPPPPARRRSEEDRSHQLPPVAARSDREASDRTRPRRFPPELRHRPPSSVNVVRSFNLSQPTAPYSLPSSSKLQGRAPTVGDLRANSIAAKRHRPSSSPPPHRRATSPVSPRHPRVVRQVPRSVSVL
jgi:hypothetical protein